MVVAGLASASSGTGVGPEPGGSSSDGCPKIVVYYSRGSGQGIDGVADAATPAGGRRGFDNPGFHLFNALVSRYTARVVGSMANAYTAVAVTSPLPLLKRRIVNLLVGRQYFASVATGVQSLKRNLTDLVRMCHDSWLVLVGYSQGAQVTRTALSSLESEAQRRIAGVVLFGDPYFAPGEENVQNQPGYDPNQRGILRQVPGLHLPTVPAAYGGRVFSWCNAHDVICQGVHGLQNGWAEHNTYWRDAQAAADVVAVKLSSLGVQPLSSSTQQPVEQRFHVTGTCDLGTCALAEWSGPGTASFSARSALHDGQDVRIVCQAMGETVTGRSGGTSAIWDKLEDGGFVSDYYISTPGVGTFSSSLPRCHGLEVVTH
jgi:hypothetical protein